MDLRFQKKSTFILLAISLFSSCFAQDLSLKKKQVRETFEEMLTLHVDHKKMSPELLERAVKIYLEQFDPIKIYLLESEVEQIFSALEKEKRKDVSSYYNDDLELFTLIQHTFDKAVARSKKLRGEIEKELILSDQFATAPANGEKHLSYAIGLGQLKQRLLKQLSAILIEEKKGARFSQNQWTPELRMKIFQFWEKRFNRKEKLYISLGKDKEHYLVLHVLRSLAGSLDPHTAYFSPHEAMEMRISLEKQFEGIGVFIREDLEGVSIGGLIPGGAAEKSRQVFAGDQIIEINGKKVEHLEYEEILEELGGKGKKEIQLLLRGKEKADTREVKLLREKIVLDQERVQATSLPYGNGQIGIISLPSFYEGELGSSAEKDLQEAISRLERKGKLYGIVLDMRDNAGGFLSQAVKVTSLFVKKGVIVISKYAGGELRYMRNLSGKIAFQGPFLVLTSKLSASAAEIVAQALQDFGVALIVGDETTYGKGTIQYQTITDKKAKSFYKVTVGRYYTVSGRSTQLRGVEADIVIPSRLFPYKIGERFLDHPLPSDMVAAAYIDSLEDIDHQSRAWFQKHYLPDLHKLEPRWKELVPLLRANSEKRLSKDKNFIEFMKLKREEETSRFPSSGSKKWGQEDLQLAEAVNIMRDMIALD